MVHDIRDAVLEDIPQLEEISLNIFNRHHLEEYFQKYDKKSWESSLLHFMSDDSCFFRVATKDGEIHGFSISHLSFQLSNFNRRQLIGMILQINPKLPEITKGRIFVKLEKDLEQLRKDTGAVLVSIAVDPNVDFSRFLIKQGFKKSDTIYLKGGELCHN